MRNDQHNPIEQNFLRKLADNVHELAQPLSIIQASLELSLLSSITAEQFQDVAEGALREVRRAVDCMQFIACLTRFQQPAGDVQEVSLRSALENVISDLQRTLDAAQVDVLFCRPKHDPTIRISPTRLRQMLFYVLQAVQGSSRPGDLVHIEIQKQAGYGVLWVEQSRGGNDQRANDQSEAANSFPVSDTIVERALSLADTIVRNAGGRFRVTTNPLLVVADFPLGGEAAVEAGKPMAKNELTDVASQRLVASSH
jgi:C4-dicarboxylate-specific signal transduction histidine kinase